MPAAKKRTSPDGDSAAETSTRASKVRKTTAKGGKAATKKAAPAPKPAAMPIAEFKDKARPIHVHVTHTPPSIDAKESADAPKGSTDTDEAKEEEETTDPTSPAASVDLGLISSLTLLPSSFSTGSYGWKGSKKVWVELQNSEKGEGEEREKVQVMLTINATVVGSKGSKGGDAGGETEEEAPVEEKDAEE